MNSADDVTEIRMHAGKVNLASEIISSIRRMYEKNTYFYLISLLERGSDTHMVQTSVWNSEHAS